jgi:hypothetical protein
MAEPMAGQTPRTEVDHWKLELAILYVLGQNRTLCPGKWPKGPDGSALARLIAEHFKLCGWTVTCGPPAEAPTTHPGSRKA